MLITSRLYISSIYTSPCLPQNCTTGQPSRNISASLAHSLARSNLRYRGITQLPCPMYHAPYHVNATHSLMKNAMILMSVSFSFYIDMSYAKRVVSSVQNRVCGRNEILGYVLLYATKNAVIVFIVTLSHLGLKAF